MSYHLGILVVQNEFGHISTNLGSLEPLYESNIYTKRMEVVALYVIPFQGTVTAPRVINLI